MQHAKEEPGPWLANLLARQPHNAATVALANKNGTDDLGLAGPRPDVSEGLCGCGRIG